MPTITPQVRAVIGGSEDQRPRHSVISATTGKTLPPAPAAETPKTGQPAITEETVPKAVTLSPQLTALARRQQKLQQEIQAQRDKETAWESTKADYVPKSTLKAKAQENVAAALQEALGMDYEQVTQLLLAQQQGADPVKELSSKIDRLEKSQEENVNKQYEATLKQYKAETDALIATDLKAFHFINKGKHQDAVVQHIVETWQENPDTVLTVAQAAKEVEEVLRENAKAAADALKELDPPAEEIAPLKKTLPPPKPAQRTLTNQIETVPTRTYGQSQHLSMKERIAQAVARAQK